MQRDDRRRDLRVLRDGWISARDRLLQRDAERFVQEVVSEAGGQGTSVVHR